jgi:hypothetical protein
MRKFRIDKGYVLSRGGEETRKVDGRTVYVVPAYRNGARKPTISIVG